MAVILNKSIMVCTPKTGSTFCRDVVKKLRILQGTIGHIHDKWENINDQSAWQEKKFKFCFVRNYVDWYKSFWNGRMKYGWRPVIKTDVNFLDVYCRANNFEEFIDNVFDRYPNGFLNDLFRRYAKGCDFVGRFESLREDLTTALRMAGEDFNEGVIMKYPARNISGSEKLKVPYKTIEKINEREGLQKH